MTKPMYCPMSFMRYVTNTAFEKQYMPMECTPDCAWAVIYDDRNGTREYFCGITQGWFGGSSFHSNSRPIKDDDAE